MILVAAFMLLSIGFIIHLIWWRIKRPIHSSKTLLSIFVFTLIVLLPLLQLLDSSFIFTWPDIALLILLYTGCVFTYVILYSAIEQQSPSLAILNHIHQFGEQGCEAARLQEYLDSNDYIKNRLILMEQSGWLVTKETYWYLTDKGRHVGWLFESVASLFGLKKGG